MESKKSMLHCRRCKCEGCNKKAYYNKVGEINPKFCYEH